MTASECPNCGYGMARAGRFCPRCGRDLQATDGGDASHDPNSGGSRRSLASVLTWIAVGAAVVIALAAVVLIARTRRHASDAAGASTGTDSTTSVAPSTRSHGPTTTTFRAYVLRAYSIGDCVTWKPSSAGDTVTKVVPCDEPHLVEIVGRIDLDRRLHHYPSAGELQMLFNADCRRAAGVLLGHPVVDRNDQVGGIYPKADAFDRGEHTLWCWARRRSAGTAEVPYRGSLN